MRFAADENFNNDILRGLQRRQPDIDIVRIQDTEIYQSDDPKVLEWVAHEGRILLTHDARTMPNHAYERVNIGKPMLGVFVVNDEMPIGQAIEELLTVIGASDTNEWENLVVFFPL
jgi:hypothetical protein